jgi:hypothetical protein
MSPNDHDARMTRSGDGKRPFVLEQGHVVPLAFGFASFIDVRPMMAAK